MVRGVVSCDDLMEAALEGGVDVRDLLGASSAFSTWLKLRRLKREAEIAASQRQYIRYREDPQGAGSRPPYLDLWHWLIEHFSFSENAKVTSSGRTLIRPLSLDDSSQAPPWVASVLPWLLAPYGGRIAKLKMEVGG